MSRHAHLGLLREPGPAKLRDVLAKIAEMPRSDRVLAKRLHAIIKHAAPEPSPQKDRRACEESVAGN